MRFFCYTYVALGAGCCRFESCHFDQLKKADKCDVYAICRLYFFNFSSLKMHGNTRKITHISQKAV